VGPSGARRRAYHRGVSGRDGCTGTLPGPGRDGRRIPATVGRGPDAATPARRTTRYGEAG